MKGTRQTIMSKMAEQELFDVLMFTFHAIELRDKYGVFKARGHWKIFFKHDRFALPMMKA